MMPSVSPSDVRAAKERAQLKDEKRRFMEHAVLALIPINGGFPSSVEREIMVDIAEHLYNKIQKRI